jgi:hypothetical protein
VFVSGETQHVQIREEGDPPAFVNERGFQCIRSERDLRLCVNTRTVFSYLKGTKYMGETGEQQ